MELSRKFVLKPLVVLLCRIKLLLAVLLHRTHDTTRRQRLEEVRNLFVRHYCSVMGSISGPDSAALLGGGSGGMLTGLFENFAEKVGIRPARSGFY
jgi:hypothetical protein